MHEQVYALHLRANRSAMVLKRNCCVRNVKRAKERNGLVVFALVHSQARALHVENRNGGEGSSDTLLLL
eukprot:1908092-Pleurochrysis_carterae.AAC.1